MSFAELMTDNVDLLKQDGTRVQGLKASVQRRKIFMDADGLLIESGDLILRKMSTGAEETYRVIDPGFYEGFGDIPANYQMEVKKLGTPDARDAIQNVTYNVTGNNARVNVNSLDSSSNMVRTDAQISSYIMQLRQEIAAVPLSVEQRRDASEIIAEVETAAASEAPKRSVIKALLDALPQVANVAAIAGALLALFS